MESASVGVTIVTYNSERFIGPCLDSILRQSRPPVEIVVVDNASTDRTPEGVRRYGDRVRLVRNPANAGFAAAQNQAIALTSSDWVLTLNPDALLSPDFLEALVGAGGIDSRIGAVCGKLLRLSADLTHPPAPQIDSAGIYFTPAMRHFDRGFHEPDDGRFGNVEYVFGASAAAALYRRAMIADVSLADGFFDPDFFVYREDADVAWRAQLLGWRCLYTPHAVGWHVRRVNPENRRAVPAFINMHSVKNRFLLRIKNMTGALFRRHWLAATSRDLLVAGGCLLIEPGSLPAFWHLARLLPRALRKRRAILGRRRVSDDYLESWFRFEPCSRPVPELVLQ